MVKAILFDLDGTLADTGKVWRTAEETLFAALGCPWREDIQVHYLGKNADGVAEVIHQHLKPALDLSICRQILKRALMQAYRNGIITPIPGAVELVRRVTPLAPLAVVSGSPLDGIRRALEGLGVLGHFELLVSTESVPRGKPYPDGFLEAAHQLRIPPSRCLVFEDSLAGIQAARDAGMTCIARPRPNQRAEAEKHAHACVTDWKEVTPTFLRRLA